MIVVQQSIRHFTHHTAFRRKTFGPRSDETCRELLALLTPFNIVMITTDNWGSYAREVPKHKHLIGTVPALNDWRAKRFASHEKVIRAFIEKHMFY